MLCSGKLVPPPQQQQQSFSDLTASPQVKMKSVQCGTTNSALHGVTCKLFESVKNGILPLKGFIKGKNTYSLQNYVDRQELCTWLFLHLLHALR